MKVRDNVAAPAANSETTPKIELSDLPLDIFEAVFCRLDETSRGCVARTCKNFAARAVEARRSLPLPTRIELLSMGCPRPNSTKILAAFALRAPDNLQAACGLRRHHEKNAALQGLVRDNTSASFFIDRRRYTGAARDGVPQNFGWLEFPLGHYEGEFKDGQPHGRGVIIWNDGRRYEGEFKDGKEHGRGVFVREDGRRYEGEYKDGKPHGRGVFVGADGDGYEGEYKDGELHGRGVFTNTDGKKREVRHDSGNLLEEDGAVGASR